MAEKQKRRAKLPARLCRRMLVGLFILACLTGVPFAGKTEAAGAKIVSYNGHSYCVLNLNASYKSAMAYCESLGGYMASINSRGENEFLFSYIKSCGLSNVYFGLYDAGKRNWKWASKEKVSFTNWAKGEPSTASEKYAMFYSEYKNGEWNDGHFYSGDTLFLCEWDRWASQLPFKSFNVSSGKRTYNVKSKGTTIKNGKAAYVVTRAGYSPEVEYKKPLKKTYTKIVIPSTITCDGVTYKVTSIAPSACKNNKKLKAVEIGSNVRRIGKSAFQSCKKLTRIRVKSVNVKKIGANAFKGISKKAVLKV